LIELGERTGEYRIADREFVADDAGDSYISMKDVKSVEKVPDVPGGSLSQ